MIIEFNPDELSTGDLLMARARQQAPHYQYGHPQDGERRRVRLEISTELRYANYPERNLCPDAVKLENVVARVYLAEPRCAKDGRGVCHIFGYPDNVCECGPLAERRLS